MRKYYQYLSYKEINFGEVMNKSIDIVVNFNLKIPPTIYLLIKALITIQGVATLLNPKLDIAREMEPYAKNLLIRQFSPQKMAKNIMGAAKDYFDLFKELPTDIAEILYKTKEGKLGMKLEISRLDLVLSKLDRVSKNISRSIILASLVIGSAIVSTLEHVKWIGHGIFVFAIILGFWSFFKMMRK
jgi:ubiquinone biosynthesis protein